MHMYMICSPPALKTNSHNVDINILKEYVYKPDIVCTSCRIWI